MNTEVASNVPPVALYDVVPYVRRSFVEPHPDRLAVAARLFGLKPRPPERCRVLELGCAMGATIIPLAYYLPESEFVGVDLSGRQVAVGQELISELGLTNVHLHKLDIKDVPDDWGAFDYIICHGVYSWVPHDVQEGIMDRCARHLAPDGVAFVSYNTLPGRQVESGLRELSMLGFGRVADFHERLRQARAFWARIPGDAARLGAAGREGLGAAAERLADQHDGYVLFELLEGNNERLYFHEFVSRAARHDLQFLAESPISKMAQYALAEPGTEKTASVAALLGGLDVPDPLIFAEQYLDCLVQRPFRHTLLCRADADVRRRVTSDRLAGLYLGARVKPSTAAADRATAVFETGDGERLTVNTALAQAALELLGSRWPEALSLADLEARTAGKVDAEPGRYAALPRGTSEKLREFLLVMVTRGVIDLRTYSPRVSLELPDRPRLHPLARAEAQADICPSTPFRELFPMTPLARSILLALDGHTDRASMLERLGVDARQGALGEKFRVLAENNSEWLREHLAGELDRTLRLAARNGLFVS